jgi:hypothetical protein
MCTGFTCAAANINCATIGAGFDCEAECISNTPCASLGIPTLQTCGKMCNPADAGLDGGTPCEQACEHITSCTGVTCSMVQINCATLGSGFDCVAECISATPCSGLGLNTLQMCQAMCGDGGTDAGPTDAGPPTDAGSPEAGPDDAGQPDAGDGG